MLQVINIINNVAESGAPLKGASWKPREQDWDHNKRYGDKAWSLSMTELQPYLPFFALCQTQRRQVTQALRAMEF